MMHNPAYFELLGRIEIIESKIKHYENLLKFHKLFEVPIKYRKAFPKDDEYPFFEEKQFKTFPIREVGRDGLDPPLFTPDWPKEGSEEYTAAKKRMRAYAKVAKRNKRSKKKESE